MEKDDNTQEFTEEELASAVATPDLAFKAGILHQRVIVNKDGAGVPVWRPVPEMGE